MAKRIIQEHHISYDPPVTVYVGKGEHRVLTLIQWYTKKFVSLGFIIALETFVAQNRHRAIKLPKEE